MDRTSPPQVPPPVNITRFTASQPDPRSVWRDANPPSSLPEPDGQDHDRMETDDEGQGSSSEDDLVNDHRETDRDDELMDTTPDEPGAQEEVAPHGPGRSTPSLSSQIPDDPPTNDAPAPHPSAFHRPETSSDIPMPPEVTMSGGRGMPASNDLWGNPLDNDGWGNWSPPHRTASSPPTISGTPVLTATLDPQDVVQASITDSTPPREMVDPQPQDVTGPHSREGESGQDISEPPEAREEADSPGDGSLDEEERAYWADFVEDTSRPDEEELKLIEQRGHEISALDHSHWESMTFEPLEDPEYIPGEVGRITWTVKPVNGNPASPNREKIMRSPSVLIGGKYWNIKYFPRGNDGTEYMSVYIECSSAPPQESETDDDADVERTTSGEATAQPESALSKESVDGLQADGATNLDASKSPDNLEGAQEAGAEARKGTECQSWEVAAQVGCIVYNSEEPRVNAFGKSCHSFCADNADWGWTRFHGPWETIHLRQRHTRRALLQNDTLSFTAYIRTVQDDTKSLWWHTPKNGADWDSYERLGLKSLASGSFADNAIIAALSCWLHLGPIVNLVMNMKIPDPLTEPQKRKRPLFSALQKLLEYMFMKAEDKDQAAVSTFIAWLDWYVSEGDRFRIELPEPVSVWEVLRRILNFEASEADDMMTASNWFSEILLLKQPDPWKKESPISSTTLGESRSAVQPLEIHQPCSVQETLDLATSSSDASRVWESFIGQPPERYDAPAVLQIELHRQKYDKSMRRWDKLTHRIELNEKITFTSPTTGIGHQYTLFGMTVHAGALETQDFYSVIRPHGPGTQWIKYTSDSVQRGATYLTSKQAIAAHEGHGIESTGNTAVAHVVLYVKTDSISSTLLSADPFQQSTRSIPQSIDQSRHADLDCNVVARICLSAQFNKHVGRGLPSVWPSDLKASGGLTIDFQIKKTATVGDLMKLFVDSLPGLHSRLKSKPSQETCSWWYLDIGLSTTRSLPRLQPIKPDDTLEKAATIRDGCYLWLHLQELDTLRQNEDSTMTQEEQSEGMQSSYMSSRADSNTDEPADAVMTQDQPYNISPSTGPAETQQETQDEIENGTSTEAPVSAETSTSQPPPSSGYETPTSANAEDHQGNAERLDAVMSEAQDTAIPPEPDRPVPKKRAPILIYIFVKVFDSEAQTLRGVTSRVVPFENDIHAEVSKLLDHDKPLDIYHENSKSILKRDRIRPSRTFSDENLQDGSVLIAHRQPSREESIELLAQGKHTDPISYFRYLRYNEDPGYLAAHDVCSYFGMEYHSTSISNGRFHGPGTLIYSSGDVYVGDWVSDLRSGQGTLAYASGDTYTGAWAHNEPEGQGKMVYGKTNNVYEGGWKKGRRHGKGTMRYEVADEELCLCKEECESGLQDLEDLKRRMGAKNHDTTCAMAITGLTTIMLYEQKNG
ncbi:MAG: hypothetical protein Q9222_002272 [Ikaeria aurantiellina]